VIFCAARQSDKTCAVPLAGILARKSTKHAHIISKRQAQIKQKLEKSSPFFDMF
jgi:hypothetical protein